jgi:tRNA(Ile)-lysidine synthase
MPLSDSPLLSKLAAAWPVERWREVTVLVAVSGGADSVALARGLHSLAGGGGEGRLILAHFNHRLRGAESDADEQFVRDLAAHLRLQLIAGTAAGDLAASGSGEGIEGAARQARYDFLASAAARCGARYLATAHTADDQAETVLFNVLRGTGLTGLAGIPRLRRLSEATTIVRPLLDATRAEILDYLRSIGQPYRDDSSNRLEDYTRNRIRLQLLPQLERDYNPRVRDALLRIAQIAAQAEDFLDQQAETVLSVAARRIPGGVEFDLKRMNHVHPALIRHVLLLAWQEQGWPLQDMGFETWQRLVEWCQSGGAAAPHMDNLPGGVRAEIAENYLRLVAQFPKD